MALSRRHRDARNRYKPAPNVRVRWPADADRDEKESFTWTVLDLVDWTREVHQGWRWAERELRQQANAK